MTSAARVLAPLLCSAAIACSCDGTRILLDSDGMAGEGGEAGPGGPHCYTHEDCQDGRICKDSACAVPQPCGDAQHGSQAECVTKDGQAGWKMCFDGNWSSCLPPFCETVGAAEECTLPCGLPGSRVCRQNLQWGPCEAPEACNNADDDCDGQVDEGNPGGGSACDTECGPGATTCQAGQFVCEPVNPPGDEICDGLDNDCDEWADELCNQDADQYCSDQLKTVDKPPTCPGGGGDCDDLNAAVHPGAGDGEDGVEDGVDNDCDGEIDEDLPIPCCVPGQAVLCGTNEGECQKGVQVCTEACTLTECGGADYVPPSSEVCDALDNDCDGLTDEGLLPPKEAFEPNDSCPNATDLGLVTLGTAPVAMAGNLYYEKPAEASDWFKITSSIDASVPLPDCTPASSQYCLAFIVTLETTSQEDYDLCVYGGDCAGTFYANCAKDALPGGWPQLVPAQKTKPLEWNLIPFYVQVSKGAKFGGDSCGPYDLIVEFLAKCPEDGLCIWNL